MSKTLHVIYDGEVLRPEEEPDLQPNTRYRITVEDEENGMGTVGGTVYPLTMLLDLAADMGVEDLAARHDYYAHNKLEDHGDSSG